MIARFFKEPLVHFLLIGGLIFAGFSLFDTSPATPDSRQIIIAQSDLAALSARFESVWKRSPQLEEMQVMTEGLIRERVLVSAALDLGMDRGDAVIDRRLRQKMEFFAASIAQAVAPKEGELEAFYRANTAEYQTPPKFALEQVYLGERATPESVSSALAALKAGTDPAQLHHSSLLPDRFEMAPAQVLDNSFGTGFAAALTTLAVGDWAGPVRSGYGLHLVRLSDTSPAMLPPLDQVLQNVRSDWQRTKHQEVLEQYYQSLRQGYDIILPTTDEAS